MARKLPSSEASIRALRRRGMSDAAIARAVGRDSRLIGKIAPRKDGVKGQPGTGMQAALNALVHGRPVQQPARRRTKTGELAKVRGGRREFFDPEKVSARELLRNAQYLNSHEQNLTIEATWGKIANTTYRGVQYTSGIQMLYGTGNNAGVFVRRLEKFMASHPKMSDEQQAEAFLAREFWLRSLSETDRGESVSKPRYNSRKPNYSQLSKVTITGKDRARAYKRRS